MLKHLRNWYRGKTIRRGARPAGARERVPHLEALEDRTVPAVVDFSSISTWVGSGSNQAAMIVDWHNGQANDSVVWGYRWNGSATGEDMMRAVAAAHVGLYSAVYNYGGSLGLAVQGFGDDRDGNGFSVSPALPGPFSNGVSEFTSTSQIDPSRTATGSNDFYTEDFPNGYWSYWVSAQSTTSWDFAPSGMSGRTLSNGDIDGWSFAAGFATITPATPVNANVPAAITSNTTSAFTALNANTFTVTTSGFPAPTVSESGTLPAGVTFNAANGVLSGSPAFAAAGSYNLTFTAHNSIGADATQNFALNVQAPVADFSAIKTWVGSGSNQAAIIVDWHNSQPSDSVVWGYRWNGSATGEDMMRAVAAAHVGLYSAVYNYGGSLGLAVQGFGDDRDGNGFSVSPALPGPFSNGVSEFTSTSQIDPSRTATGSNDFYTEDFPNGYWSYWVSAQSTTSWDFAPSGMSDRTLSNGDIDGWSFAAGFADITPTSPVNANVGASITSNASAAFSALNTSSFTVMTSGFPAATLSESGALPAGVTFNAANGVLGGTPALAAVGSYNLGFTANNGIGASATQNFTLNVQNPVTKLVLAAPATQTAAGAATGFTITAKDLFGNVASGYTGTVALSSSDAQANFAAPAYTFTTADAGLHVFSVTLNTVGTQSLTAFDFNNGFVARQTGITVTAASASHLQVSGLGATTAGVANNLTVAAQDTFGNVVSNFAGTVLLSSSDGQASPGASSYTFTPGDHGVHVFSAMLKTAGTQSIQATDAADGLTGVQSGILVAANTATGLSVSGFNSTSTAGAAHNFRVTAHDAYGNLATGFTGAVSLTSSDGGVSFDTSNYTFTTGVGNDNGVHTFSGVLTTAGPQSITAAAPGLASGSEGGITVNPAAAAKLVLAGYPSHAVTNQAHNFTLSARDAFNNVATGYTGTVRLTSSDSTAMFDNASYTFAGSDQGVHAFALTFKTPGAAQTFNAVDTGNPAIVGGASTQVHGLMVASFTPTTSGFTATFNMPVNTALLNLYDAALAGYGSADMTVSLDGAAVPGSLLVNAAGDTITFVQTGGALQPGTYAVTFRSAANGFADLSGGLLAGDVNGVSAGTNFTSSFTVGSSAAILPTLSVPDFARGPDSNNTIKVPNNGTGIPVTLGNASAVTDASFTLSYNAALLNITGVSGSGLTLVSNAGGVASFHFASATAQDGTAVLGQILASVPSSAATAYRLKELLHLGNIVINRDAGIAAVGDDAIHVNAYLGDANGDGKVTGADINLISRIPGSLDSGFGAYPLLDAAILADVTGDGNVNATDIGQMNRFVANLSTGLVPTPPGLSMTPTGPDPALSIPTDLQAVPGGVLRVPVTIDDPHPDGSNGLTNASLALTYDPSVFSVSASDIRLGSIPASGTAWHLTTHVDPATGQIGIEIYSVVPIASANGGSLVTIDFHTLNSAATSASAINLVPSVNPNGRVLTTWLGDDRGGLTLHTQPTTGVDATDGVVHINGAPAATAPVENTAPRGVASESAPVTEAMAPVEQVALPAECAEWTAVDIALLRADRTTPAPAELANDAPAVNTAETPLGTAAPGTVVVGGRDLTRWAAHAAAGRNAENALVDDPALNDIFDLLLSSNGPCQAALEL